MARAQQQIPPEVARPAAPTPPAPSCGAPAKPKMLLVDLVTFRLTYFAGKRPDLRTMRRWIDDGELPGLVIAGWYYVDALALERKTGSSIADKFLDSELRG